MILSGRTLQNQTQRPVLPSGARVQQQKNTYSSFYCRSTGRFLKQPLVFQQCPDELNTETTTKHAAPASLWPPRYAPRYSQATEPLARCRAEGGKERRQPGRRWANPGVDMLLTSRVAPIVQGNTIQETRAGSGNRTRRRTGGDLRRWSTQSVGVSVEHEVIKRT